MATKKTQTFTISIKVDPVTYATYKSLSDQEKRRLLKLIRMIILATKDESFSDLLNLKVEVDLSEETKEFLRSVVRDGNEVEELAKEAIAFIKFLVNATEVSPRECPLLEYNKVKALLILERARQVLS